MPHRESCSPTQSAIKLRFGWGTRPYGLTVLRVSIAVDKQDKYERTKKVTKTKSRPLWVSFVHYSPRQAHNRRDNRRLQTSADSAARQTAIATVFIAFFTLVLAAVSFLQWSAARGQLNEMQSQNKVMKDQLVGTEAAVINPNDVARVSLSSPYASIDFYFQNTGHVNARNVNVTFSVRRITVPYIKTIGHTFTGEFSRQIVRPLDPSDPNKGPDIRFAIPVSSEQLLFIQQSKQTIEVSGKLAYDDGFGDAINVPFCERFFTYKVGSWIGDARIVRCDEWIDAYQGEIQSIQNFLRVHPEYREQKKSK